MLPTTPSANFKLPSLYDDLELDCRLYFPHTKSNGCLKGLAIFAHPYAPLGGNFDDYVVHIIGELLSSVGFLLLTFNFRGADKSPGKTTWSGKAELGDYVSLYAFAVSFINSDGVGVHLVSRSVDTNAEQPPILLLGGYSYGSMMAAHLPEFTVVSKILHQAQDGSAEREIQLRASELAQAFLGWCEARQHRGRSSLKGSDGASALSSSFGGYESAQASSRISRDTSRRSIDRERVRHSIDRVRQRLASRDHQSIGDGKPEDIVSSNVQSIAPRISYLLISPLLGPVSSLATLFSNLRFERRDRHATAARDVSAVNIDEALSENSSLIVFGADDNFTSSRKVRDWCESIKRKPSSRMVYQEVENAGHFWHNKDVSNDLVKAVTSWVVSI